MSAKVVTIAFPYEEYHQLKRHCVKVDVSRSAMIRSLLRMAFKKGWIDEVKDFGIHSRFRKK